MSKVQPTVTNIPNPLINLLRHPDVNQRSSAARGLAGSDDPGTLTALIEALRTETDLFVREDITYALARLGQPAAAAVAELLQVEDAHLRHQAAHTLGKIGHKHAVDALIESLEDTDARVVSKAVVALGQIGDASAIPALVQLLGHEDADVFASLSHVLEGFGAPAVPPLADALQHDDWPLRERAAEILGAIDDQTATASLIGALNDDAWQVRFAVVAALSSRSDQTVRVMLRGMIDDPNAQVSALVRQILR